MKSFLKWQKKGIKGCGELKVPLKWDSPEMDQLLTVIDKFGMPLVFHMEKSGCVYAADGQKPLDKFMAKLLNTPRFNGIPHKVIDTAGMFIGPLKKKRESMKAFFPGYLLDFAALEMKLREYPNIKFVGHGPMFWVGISRNRSGVQPAQEQAGG